MLRLFRREPSRRQLEAEIERLMGIIADPKLIDIGIEDGSIRITCQHWAARLMALSFADSLGDARNWATFEIGPLPTTKGMLLCTIQRAGGDSPVATAAKGKEIIADLIRSFSLDAIEWPEPGRQAAVARAVEFINPTTAEAGAFHE